MTWDGTPIAPSADPSYAEYTAAGGSVIAEADWPRYLLEAKRIVADVTFGLSDIADDATLLARLDEAYFRVADVLFAVATGVVSEKLGTYAVTYAEPMTVADARGEACRALAGTELTFRGI